MAGANICFHIQYNLYLCVYLYIYMCIYVYAICSMDLRYLLLNIVFISVVNAMLAFGIASQDERRCSVGRIEKLMRIRCYNMDLKEVPQNMKTSVEVSRARHQLAGRPATNKFNFI